MTEANTPTIIFHPEYGRMRSMNSFSVRLRPILEGLIAGYDVRCILLEGHRFVPLADVEPYSVADLDELDAD
jgi:hypothetical protein